MRLTHTLSEEGKFRLRVLVELNAFVHCSNDVCLGQELVRDVLLGSDSDSECDASSGTCGGFCHVLHVADPPPGSRCIQVVHVLGDFCFLGVPLRSDFGVGDIEFLHEGRGRHQDWATQNVTIVHVPQVHHSQSQAALETVRQHLLALHHDP